MPDFEELQNRLPSAFQSFTELRRDGAVYVDKTAFVQTLAGNRKPRILTRPRRFGKSTLLSTLEELFLHGVEPYDGHNSYFKGLAIEKTWKDHGNYPVLHLDFHGLNSSCVTAEQFRNKLIRRIADFCEEHSLTVRKDPIDLEEQLDSMLARLPPASLVLLIDEYDSPLLYHAQDEKELRVCTLLMRELFSTVKRRSDKFRCVFFTGISMDSDYAACCGYTRGELKHCFTDHLRYAAAVRLGIKDEEVTEENVESLLDEMALWYNGYSFDGKDTSQVFSTWSVLRFFSDREARLRAYRSTEEGLGLPRLLKLSLERLNVSELLQEVSSGEIKISATQFIQSSLTNPEASPYALLFQTGYLTLRKPFDPDRRVSLHCPNRELSIAFANLIGRRLFNRTDLYTEDYSEETVAVLQSLEPEKIKAYFNDIFAAIPYEHYPVNSEAMVAALINVHLHGARVTARQEVSSSKGRADCVIDLPRKQLTLVFEYKYTDSADAKHLDKKVREALVQIREHAYGLNCGSEHRVARFALVFCGAKEVRGLARVVLADEFMR